ncbi:valyl-tRNA synthetase [Ereboglobus sp. PH5-10]|uniref:valine--tRNA ligase n=1 Tax=Ereboglobus sp. PH5-10 TaxID=2940629 RepID=UPI002405CE8C|nr:valine--tRNA ligase [Ereboglobus sp. PH5-10]MDF9826275.1 valyl-tRNA synthetase [Ereboglobus sp. PH5-10]
MSAEITKSYEPHDVEKKWYSAWMQARAFAAPEPKPGQETHTIVIPPPNVTGILHMGHALNNTLQDVLTRRARLEGKAACWIPGTDHAGIATQTMVEKHIKKTEGKTRYDLGRDEFLKRVWAWRDEKGDLILRQLRELGCSCDWDRTHFTMDPGYSRAVLTAFVKLYKQGLIYRGKRMVNWCPVSLTALSDEEVEMRPTKGHIYRVRYELVEPAPIPELPEDARPLPPEAINDGRVTHIVLETTRPETIAADVAVAVHPDDPRYKTLIGKKVWRPLGERVQIAIIADAAVDPVFAAGALKVTPAHDKVDFDIGQRHKLPVIDSINADGTMNAGAGPELAGLDRFVARKKSAEILSERGALIEAKPYENNVGYSQRAGVPIEPRLTWQWWLRYPRVEEAKQVVRDGTIKFHPERWTKVYLNWLENIQDWCISRQLWWGHRIPVWYRKGVDRDTLTPADLADPQKIHVSLDGPADPENWTQEDDVLDTWASSWLWPFATLGWPDAAAMKAANYDTLYPTTTLATGADIIFFWVARMIMAGLEFTHEGEPLEKRIPFKHVYFNGIVRDKQGRKMSKSLGNSPDPLDLIKKYGADGLRFGMLQIAPLGQDVKFDEDRIEGGKNFCNKLWNACRFRQMSSGSAGVPPADKERPAPCQADNSSLDAILARLNPAQLDDDDHALLGALLDTMRVLERSFAEFEFATATQRLYSFFWNDFCDWYVEVAKTRVQDPAAKTHALAMQDLVIREFLLLFAPFAPFITEELWHLLGYGAANDLLQNTRLETADELVGILSKKDMLISDSATARVEKLQQTATLARQLKAEQSVAQKRDVKFLVLADDANWTALSSNAAKLARLVGAASIERAASEPALPAIVTPLGTLYLDTGVKVDAAAERARLTKELAQLEKHIAGTQARLANEAFVSKAPPAVLEGAKKQLADQQAKKAELERLLKAL